MTESVPGIPAAILTYKFVIGFPVASYKVNAVLTYVVPAAPVYVIDSELKYELTVNYFDAFLTDVDRPAIYDEHIF